MKKEERNEEYQALFIDVKQYVQLIELADEPTHSTEKTIKDLKHLILRHLYSD